MSGSDQRLSKTALLGFLATAASYPLFFSCHTDRTLGIIPIAFLASLAGGLVISILGVIRIARSHGELRGMGFALLGLFGLIPWTLLLQRVL